MMDAKEFAKRSKTGMRFWMPGEVIGAPPEFRRASVPFGVTQQGITITPAIYRDLVHPHLNFTGECYVTDPQDARHLMVSTGGRVYFDPQEAVSKLGIPADEVRAMGFAVVDQQSDKQAPAPASPVRARPNFHSMSKSELQTWADDNAIFVANGRKEDMVAELERKLNELDKKAAGK